MAHYFSARSVMAWHTSILFLALLHTVISQNRPQLVEIPHDDTYFTAAVFEHAKLGNTTTDSPFAIVAMNLDFFRRAAETAKAKGADIIVFPEYGIIPYFEEREKMKVSLEKIPDPKFRSNPCVQSEEFATRPILKHLSCMARDNHIVVVANIGEIQPCTKETTDKCPADGSFHFNTNVAFDRDGTLLAIHRKEQLFFEISMDLPIEPQNATFQTDFATLAMYICFETLFKPMALSGRSVDAVILTTMWIDSRPNSAIQHWMSWAVGNAASLIVANVQIPGYGAVGSGIFNGKLGALKYTNNPDGLSKLVVSRIPKRGYESYPLNNTSASITVITADGSRPYEVDVEDEGRNIPDICNWEVLGDATDIYKDYRCAFDKTKNNVFHRLVEREGTAEACHNGLCCSIKYSTDSMNEVFYLAVYNGTYNAFDRYYWCEEKCFVVRCDSVNGSECNTYPAKSTTVFKSLEIKANFTMDFTYPSIVTTGYRLAPKSEWDLQVDKADDGSFSGTLTYDNVSAKPLLVAAIYGRCYDRDPPYIR